MSRALWPIVYTCTAPLEPSTAPLQSTTHLSPLQLFQSHLLLRQSTLQLHPLQSHLDSSSRAIQTAPLDLPAAYIQPSIAYLQTYTPLHFYSSSRPLCSPFRAICSYSAIHLETSTAYLAPYSYTAPLEPSTFLLEQFTAPLEPSAALLDPSTPLQLLDTTHLEPTRAHYSSSRALYSSSMSDPLLLSSRALYTYSTGYLVLQSSTCAAPLEPYTCTAPIEHSTDPLEPSIVTLHSAFTVTLQLILSLLQLLQSSIDPSTAPIEPYRLQSPLQSTVIL